MQSSDDPQSVPQAAVPTRKPAIALMGEFSAGKSTLSNLLIGARALPVQVTATQLPPVWIAYGDAPPVREDLNGATHPVDLHRIEDIPVAETRCVRIHRKAQLLSLCDIIDMPGISDPNMESEVWERVLPSADAVIWCTHATQAWRQSEAAVWDMVPAELQSRSLLLLTRFDKITGAEDRRRVLRRVERETEDLFAKIFPISLTDALAAGDDRDAWAKSGAEAFTQALIDLVQDLSATMGSSAADADAGVHAASTGVDGAFLAREADADADETPAMAENVTVLPRRVMPVRPTVHGSPRRDRPEAGSRPA